MFNAYHNFLDKSSSFSDFFSSLTATNDSEHVSQVDHHVSNSIENLSIVLLLSSTDLLQTSKVILDVGEEDSQSSGDLGGFFHQLPVSSGHVDGGVGEFIQKGSEAS